MVGAAASFLAGLASRWVPSAFSIACLLSLLTVLLGVTVGRASFLACLAAWGNGFWVLLSFAMQIALVIFCGYILTVAPPVRRALERLADLPRSPRAAVATLAALSMGLCWLNWGMGLVASSVLVLVFARRHKGADYRLLVAAGYFGMGATWHAGPSGSVPLLLATPGHFLESEVGVVPVQDTIFLPFNLALTAVAASGLVLLAAALLPSREQIVAAPAEALGSLAEVDPPHASPAALGPAEWLERSRVLNLLMGALGLGWLGIHFAQGGALTLDVVNFAFLFTGILLHRSPASLLAASADASKLLHGVVLQFPLYAGMYGIMKDTELAARLASLFVSASTPESFTLLVFWYSALLNYFVPSGGSKWAIEAPYLVEAARAHGIPLERLVLSYAYGDMATNFIQPFWALPLLAVARIEFREVLGFLILPCVFYTLLVSAALLIY